MGNRKNDEWACVQRAPEEREQIILDLMAPLKHLSSDDLFYYRWKFENITIDTEMRGDDLKVKSPRPPASLFGKQPRTAVEKNIAEWVLYTYDFDTLIDEKRAEGRQLKLALPSIRSAKK
ncbi:hypothetical protein [uncultured Oxalicibacterium sp.]|uniref:hypothetical protein n=1 Tax=uncultured Oxalicibacterium sp. TaxID=1168540 RepID=UPI0025FA23E2|nr:hypothetical protein [uncultured Oxalicibacterium sp.]